MMQWIDANTKDADVLKRVDLSPLDVDPAEVGEPLAQAVQRHNKALRNLTERFKTLTGDREALNRADQWFDHDSQAVLNERRRVVAESWDVLVALGRLIRDRHDLLLQLQGHVADKISDLEQQYGQAFDKAHKAISRENRSYLKAEPVRGPAWAEAEAENDEAVVALRDQITPLRDTLNRLASAYHRANRNSALIFRQREVYEQLN
ncbi:MAG: hypothetical protein JXL80_10525 [Planctomycetes bacterium]|nr:hypothetical protein [Planctomycetota bacterium]